MNRIGMPLALTVALLLAAPLSAGSHTVVFDHGTNTLICNKIRQTSPCVIRAAEGDLLELSVLSSSPSLVTASVTKIDLHAAERTMIQEKLFPTPPANGVGTKAGTPMAFTGTIVDAYEAVGVAIGHINEAISGTDPATGGMNHYAAAKQELAAAVTALVGETPSGKPSDVPKAIKDADLARELSDAELDVWWKNVLSLNKLSNVLQPMLGRVISIADDTDVTVTFALATQNPLIAGPPAGFSVAARIGRGWRLTSSTGFAASRLVDDVYTVRTVVDTPATATTPEVSHREALREDRDAATPEACFFVHTRYLGQREASTRWLPRELTFGVGVATGTSGRLYTGFGYSLGSRASITVGVAAGKVKRLSKNVNEKNLGTDDPEASKRDAFQFAPFVALSWRFNE